MAYEEIDALSYEESSQGGSISGSLPRGGLVKPPAVSAMIRQRDEELKEVWLPSYLKWKKEIDMKDDLSRQYEFKCGRESIRFPFSPYEVQKTFMSKVTEAISTS